MKTKRAYKDRKAYLRNYYKTYKNTAPALIARIYQNQRVSQKYRNKELSYTYFEFKSWCNKNKDFKCLLEMWKSSGFEKDLKPSVDRIDHTKGYNFSNIRFVTWLENRKKGNLETARLLSKPVEQYTKDGLFIQRWESISSAEEQLNISNISSVLNGSAKRQKYCGGYYWKYAN